jgi:chromosome partitioning protein
LVASGLKDLSLPLGFRAIDGFAERVVYREFFPRGLTALDDLDEATLGTRPSMGHVSAREMASLLRQLKLPLNERGRRRAANRAPNGSARSTSRSKSTRSSAFDVF